MRFQIKQSPTCRYIDVTDHERDEFFTGDGWRLARFENGHLRGLFDPLSVPHSADVRETADEALIAAMNWIRAANGDEVWWVLCSGSQMRDPLQIFTTDEAAVAKVESDIGQSLTNR